MHWGSHRFSPALRASKDPVTCLTQLLLICRVSADHLFCFPLLTVWNLFYTAHPHQNDSHIGCLSRQLDTKASLHC